VTSLVAKHDRILAQRVEWALDHNEPLDQLSSDPNILPASQVRARLSAGAGGCRAAGPSSLLACRACALGLRVRARARVCACVLPLHPHPL